MLKVGFVQNCPRILRVEENLKNCLALMQGKNADLWVLPEFFVTGYNFKNRREVHRVAEEIPGGPTCKALMDFSIRNHCAVVAGLVEKSGGNYFNSAALVQRKKISIYRKTHLFGIEKKFFKKGDTGFWIEQVAGAHIGVMICFDWFFPESARTLALKGAEIILHPANLVLPWGPEGMKMRSIENRLFSVTANRIGTERGLKFIGQSQIVAPDGEILVRAVSDKCQVAVVKIYARLARNKKITNQNDIWRDRRTESYFLK